MSMCSVFSCVVGRGCLLWPVHFLGKTLLVLPCFIPYSKAKFVCYSRCFLTSYFCIPVPYNEKEKEMATHPSVLAWRILGTAGPGGLPSMESHRVGHDWSDLAAWRPTRPFRTNTQKRCPFHYRGLKCKSRKSRNTWSNRQIWPWSTEWSRAKLCQENALVIANTLFPTNTREDSTHGHHQMVNTEIRMIIFFAAKDGEAVYSR